MYRSLLWNRSSYVALVTPAALVAPNAPKYTNTLTVRGVSFVYYFIFYANCSLRSVRYVRSEISVMERKTYEIGQTTGPQQ